MRPLPIPADLHAILASGPSAMVGTRDGRLRPDCMRVTGSRVGGDGTQLTVYLPEATSARTLANLRDNGRIAAVFTRIGDNHAFQAKGAVLGIRRADGGDREAVEGFMAGFRAALVHVGFPPRVTLRLAHWPCHAVRMSVEELFVQTPGPGAGAPVGAPPAPALAAGASPPARSREEADAADAVLPLDVRLEDHLACFQGVVPSAIATCDPAGVPNVTDLSQVHYLSPRRVALSCQFFNKTKRNVLANPYATLEVLDPLTFDAYRMELRLDHVETAGPLFDGMAMRIQVIASHTGMSGVFRLLSADVYDVLAAERTEGFLLPPGEVPEASSAPDPRGPLTELRGLQAVSDRIARACDLESMLAGALEALDEVLGFSHAMVLLPECSGGKLVAIASRGYGPGGIGAEVPMGEGIIGTVAARRRMARMAGVGSELRYGRAIRERVEETADGTRLRPQIPLPGLPDAQAQLALPLLVGERLVGVLAVESRNPMQFDEWDEAFLGIVGNQIALGVDRTQGAEEEDAAPSAAEPPPAPVPPAATRRFTFFRNDDCVFVDGEYLIRNVPGKILWKVLDAHRREGRVEFSNRELRLDPWLGLPPVKDNLESRLILLRRRLEEKCPEVRLVPVRRGRFALRLECGVELSERECG